MPIRHSLFGGVRGAPSTARRGWASADPLGACKQSAQRRQARRRQRWKPRGRDAIGGSMRSTTAPGIAGRRKAVVYVGTDARGLVEPELRLYSNPRTRRTAFAHSCETTEPKRRRSGFAPMHGCGCTVPQKSAHPPIRNSVHATKRLSVPTRAAARTGRPRATISRPGHISCAVASGRSRRKRHPKHPQKRGVCGWQLRDRAASPASKSATRFTLRECTSTGTQHARHHRHSHRTRRAPGSVRRGQPANLH